MHAIHAARTIATASADQINRKEYFKQTTGSIEQEAG
jgi:hypothetical protein